MIFLTDTLKDRMGVQPMVPIKVSVIVDTLLNFDGDFDEDDGVTCKQTLNIHDIFALLTASFWIVVHNIFKLFHKT